MVALHKTSRGRDGVSVYPVAFTRLLASSSEGFDSHASHETPVTFCWRNREIMVSLVTRAEYGA